MQQNVWLPQTEELWHGYTTQLQFTLFSFHFIFFIFFFFIFSPTKPALSPYRKMYIVFIYNILYFTSLIKHCRIQFEMELRNFSTLFKEVTTTEGQIDRQTDEGDRQTSNLHIFTLPITNISQLNFFSYSYFFFRTDFPNGFHLNMKFWFVVWLD